MAAPKMAPALAPTRELMLHQQLDAIADIMDRIEDRCELFEEGLDVITAEEYQQIFELAHRR